MEREVLNEYGRIVFDKEVLATLAGIAATECFGIVGMASKKLSHGIAELLGKDALSKGVEILDKDDKIVIQVNIIVGYGTKMSEIAHNVISNVKYVVENFTGLQVDQVHVNIQGVRMVD